MPSSDAAVRTSGLSKTFGSHHAVNGLDLTVPSGSVYGFLGPNGSGKTTTIRMLLGLIQPSSGSHELLGHSMPDDLRLALPKVGALVEGPAFHPYLTGTANLRRLDAADAQADPSTRHTRIMTALERVGLTNAADKKYRAYSLGMKQRLGIAAALLQPRDLLVLDEPTNGLDPQGTREVRHLVASLAQDGTTVLISSHLLAEVEQVCSHVGVMRAGRLVAQGSLEELRGGQQSRVTVTTPDPALAAEVLGRHGVDQVSIDGTAVSGIPGQLVAEDLVADLVRAGVRVCGFTVAAPKLEDLYVALTGEGFEVRE